jgi:hypothetical protein
LKIQHGRVYLVNDRQRLTDMIERRSLFACGTFIPYDFTQVNDVPIPSQSIDLVVCYMGLHHIPQQRLDVFIRMIYRILRPNGLFIFREHHACESLKPLVDVAHMVFNVVTGVDEQAEANEIRAFRTIEQWRSCLRQAGFDDTFIYDEQDDDPTDDIMIAMRKPAQVLSSTTDDHRQIIRDNNLTHMVAYPESNYFRSCEWLVVRLLMQFGQFLNHTPFYFFPFVRCLTIYWSMCWTETQSAVNKFGWKTALTASPGFFMNIVVGTFLSIAFLQLAFFSFLIRVFSGIRLKPEYEQIILQQIDGDVNNRQSFEFTHLIDAQIDQIERSIPHGLYAIRVPRHHVFTRIMRQLATYEHKFQLLSVSGQTEDIHMEVAVRNNDVECILWLKQRAHMDVIFDYRNPIEASQTHWILRVQIKYLFAFLNDCRVWESKHSLNITQIYDHFD